MSFAACSYQLSIFVGSFTIYCFVTFLCVLALRIRVIAITIVMTVIVIWTEAIIYMFNFCVFVSLANCSMLGSGSSEGMSRFACKISASRGFWKASVFL